MNEQNPKPAKKKSDVLAGIRNQTVSVLEAVYSTLRQRPHLVLLTFLPVYILFWLPLVGARSADATYLNHFSRDEYMFIQHAYELYLVIKNQDFGAIISFELKWTYGMLYYFLLLPVFHFHQAGDIYGTPLLAARSLSVVLAFATAYLAYLIAVNTTRSRAISFSAGASVLLMAGLLAWHKMLSPETLSNFLVLATFYFATVRTYSKRAKYWVAITLGVALSVKLNALMFLPSIFLLFLLNRTFGANIWQRAKHLALMGPVTVFTFFAVNFPLIFSGRVRELYVRAVESQAAITPNSDWAASADTISRHLDQWLYNNNTGSVDFNFMSPVLAAIMITLIGVCAVLLLFRRRLRQAFTIAALMSAVVLPIGYVFITGRPYWHWYMIPSFALLLVSTTYVLKLALAAFGAWSRRRLRAGGASDKRGVTKAVAFTICALILPATMIIDRTPHNLSLMSSRTNEDNSLHFRRAQMARYLLLNHFDANRDRITIDTNCSAVVSYYTPFILTDYRVLRTPMGRTLAAERYESIEALFEECAPNIILLQFRPALTRGFASFEETLATVSARSDYDILMADNAWFVAVRNEAVNRH